MSSAAINCTSLSTRCESRLLVHHLTRNQDAESMPRSSGHEREDGFQIWPAADAAFRIVMQRVHRPSSRGYDPRTKGVQTEEKALWAAMSVRCVRGRRALPERSLAPGRTLVNALKMFCVLVHGKRGRPSSTAYRLSSARISWIRYADRLSGR